MSGQFFSPEDHLQLEEAKRTRALLSDSGDGCSNADHLNAAKKQRCMYEGEPDTAKWAVQPAPDIFAAEPRRGTSTTLHGGSEGQAKSAEGASSQSADHMAHGGASAVQNSDASEPEPDIQLSGEVMHQIRSLCIAQNDFERRLFEHRERIIHEQEKARGQIEARELICPMPKKERDAILRQHRADLERADRRAIEKLDELRYQQQLKLQSLGVDGFYPSSSVAVMQRQQSILKHLLSK
ncbi:hypothetical protein GQ54DRAFT_219588 [Martensiomyces pterosporus]|nr:hypothetical protein GQ54DRAFT_219588 [Martensiomyces pterosporus]